MATKTVTISTSDWNYIDKMGVSHPVTNLQTFQFTLTDTSTTDVTYSIDAAQTVTTDDGYTIYFRPESNQIGTARTIGKLTDAMDGVVTYGVHGEMVCECPVSGIIQRWTLASTNIDDIDAPTALTAIRFEDQFGNKMDIVTAAVA